LQDCACCPALLRPQPSKRPISSAFSSVFPSFFYICVVSLFVS